MKKIIVICLMSFLLCSCHDVVEESSSMDSRIMTKQDEILKIMRDDLIQKNIKAGGLSFREKKELKKMKKDYYYELSNPDMLLTIPGPDWKLVGPIDVANEEYKLIEEYNEGDENFFAYDYRQGDELYFYRSDELSWAYLRGRRGYILIRDNEVVDYYMTGMN